MPPPRTPIPSSACLGASQQESQFCNHRQSLLYNPHRAGAGFQLAAACPTAAQAPAGTRPMHCTPPPPLLRRGLLPRCHPPLSTLTDGEPPPRTGAAQPWPPCGVATTSRPAAQRPPCRAAPRQTQTPPPAGWGARCARRANEVGYWQKGQMHFPWPCLQTKSSAPGAALEVRPPSANRDVRRHIRRWEPAGAPHRQGWPLPTPPGTTGDAHPIPSHLTPPHFTPPERGLHQALDGAALPCVLRHVGGIQREPEVGAGAHLQCRAVCSAR